MKRKRKQYSGAFKAQIGLEALTGIKTTAQIARENQVHPLLVAQWKKIVRERLPEVFERGLVNDNYSSPLMTIKIPQR